MSKKLAKKTLVIAISVASFALIPAAIMFNGTQMEAKADGPPGSAAESAKPGGAAPAPVVTAAAKVSVLNVTPSTHSAHINVYGEITPAFELSLSSEVSGMIEWMSSDFSVGAFVKKGTPLVRLSQRNYLPAVVQAEQDLATAKQARVAAEQSLANAKLSKANARQATYTAQEASATAQQAIASAEATNVGSLETIASAKQAASLAYKELADADLALKQAEQEARVAKQTWDKEDDLATAQREVNDALVEVKEEKERARVAQEAWKVSGMRGKPSELASRQPYLAAAYARLNAAKLAFQEAQFNVNEKRTELGQHQPQMTAAKARVNSARAQLEVAQQTLNKAYAERKVDEPRLKAAQSQLNTARSSQQTAQQQSTVADLEIKSAEAQLGVENAKIKTAEANLAKAKKDLALTEIRAPFDAVVTSRAVSVGSYVSIGSSLADIQSSTQLETSLSLSTDQWTLLPDNYRKSTIQLSSDEQPDAQWQGTVKRVANFIQESTRTRDLIVAVDALESQQTRLLAGQFVQADIPGKPLQDLLKVPGSALAASGYVWFVDEQKQLQKFKADVAFSQDGQLYIHAPDGVQTMQIVRWPLASYLPGTVVLPEVVSDTAASDVQAAAESQS